MEEDTYDECAEVKEALRRLPRNVAEERQYRITRALYLSMRHEVLPQDQWTSYETVFIILPYFSEQQQQQQPFYSPLSGTTRVSWYQKKHSPTHTYSDHQPSFISFLHLLRSIASSLFNLHG